MWAFSGWGGQGLLSSSIAQASHCMAFLIAEHQALGTQASGVAARGLSS